MKNFYLCTVLSLFVMGIGCSTEESSEESAGASQARGIASYTLGKIETRDPELYVAFADKNLERAVKDALNIPSGQVPKKDFISLKKLNLSGREITDLTGLEYAEGLTELKLAHNEISNIAPLINLSKLKVLNLAHNNISDVSVLRYLRSLAYLNLANNKIEEITDLSHQELSFLDISDNDIYDVSVLNDQTSLKSLNLSGLPYFIDLSGFQKLDSLEILDISENKISHAKHLQSLKGLKTLSCRDMVEFDFSSLEGLKLENIDLTGNDLIHIGFLFGMNSLKDLNLSRNRLDKESLAIISTLFNLNKLNLSSNFISGNIDLSSLKHLNDFLCSNNALRDATFINFSEDASVRFLDVSNNHITQLYMVGGKINEELETLDLSLNSMEDFASFQRKHSYIKNIVSSSQKKSI